MGNLLPVEGAKHIEEGVSEYLTTSFSLADSATSQALREFLLDPEDGMFHGPYVRTRLPYAPASNWEGILSWLPSWFTPYRHQAEAFRRLSGQSPSPTLVVTGTGSGKTESFLYPIIDYCLKQRREAGPARSGIKAIILYPMNALANDQAARLAELIDEISTELGPVGGIRAGKYTGESGSSAKMTKKTLIEDRQELRDSPPDILLTNYKMLNELLLRPADQEMLAASADSLRYLVLDEFHTYDGAQGTDVALLLRRLGLFLKSKRRLPLTTEESEWPLGAIVPVATSATMGSREDPFPMLSFAETVFGRPFDASAVVMESLMTLPRWQEEMLRRFGAKEAAPLGADAGAPEKAVDVSTVTDVVAAIADESASAGMGHEMRVNEVLCDKVLGGTDSEDLDGIIVAIARSPLYCALFAATETARPLSPRAADETPSLVEAALPAAVVREAGEPVAAEFLAHLLSHVAYVRYCLGLRDRFGGKVFPGVETHLWIREVSRVDRAAGTREFRWSDDGTSADASGLETSAEGAQTWLPACYCRNCGRSGWMVQLEAGTNEPVFDVRKIRRGSLTDKSRQRALIEATAELADAEGKGLSLSQVRPQDGDSAAQWLNLRTRTLGSIAPSEADIESQVAVPVLALAGQDAEKLAAKETCPSCGASDSIRFLGSSVATLLSVALSNLFGMPDLDAEEKKTLVFTDSVQDAAHRAGFVQSRSRKFTLRSFIRRAIGDLSPRMPNLFEVSQRLEQLAGTAREKYELLPPERASDPVFRGYWDATVKGTGKQKAKKNASQRLALDLALEMGDQAGLARSLSLTGAACVEVAASRSELTSAARAALTSAPPQLQAPAGAELEAWARGVVEMIRLGGGIYHEWFDDYLDQAGNPYQLNKRAMREKGMPGFARGAAPKFPWVVSRRGSRSGAKQGSSTNEGMVNAVSAKSGYADWTHKCLGVSPHDAGLLMAGLLDALSARDVLRRSRDRNGDAVYSISPQRVMAGIDEAPMATECEVCHTRMGLPHATCELLAGGPCTTFGCSGTLRAIELAEDYYRRLYQNEHPRTIIAREHTSMLEKKERTTLERDFRSTESTKAYTPNVLVATPTLEMGIDIGDLSTVMLASLPTSVSSYVQRVGRAGRLTGNSLVLAVVQGRGITLPKLNQPLSVVSGVVTPPAAYLSAVDILRRQFIAHLLTVLADYKAARGEPWVLSQSPQLKAKQVFQDSTGVLAVLLGALDEIVEDAVEAFLSTVSRQLSTDEQQRLRHWALDPGSGLRAALAGARARWREESRTLSARKVYLEQELDRLERRAPSDKKDGAASTEFSDEKLQQELRDLKAGLKATNMRLSRELFDEHWVSSLERYGLLPNFTLLDDSVELTLDISAQNPETLDFELESRSYQRGVSAALFELAPGSTFYAQGLAARVDSVDLGAEHSNIERWRLCPECSYMADATHESVTPASCPECGASAFSDVGQCIPVVQMRRVSAAVDKARATITDARDDRIQLLFHSTMTAVAPHARRGQAWYTTSTGFGAQYLPELQLRWLNLGLGQGETLYLGGRETMAPRFRVCSQCGHLDSEVGSNSARDHRPWCPERYSDKETTTTFAMGRTLNTQGVFLFLPQLLSAADSLTIPSLIAALRLGFKEVLGGDPDHLSVAGIRVGDSGSRRDVLLLHDQVPGGTGYLTQFSEPEAVHELLLAAWKKVSSCTCHDDVRLCCPNCLLPYAGGLPLDHVSRQAAESSLLKLLTDNLHPEVDAAPGGELARDWSITSEAPTLTEESELELKFRKVLEAFFKAKKVAMGEHADVTHTSTLSFRFSADSPPWRMEAQRDFGFTRPDFYFERQDTSDHALAVFLDGYTFHASPRNNNAAADLAKREQLRRRGVTVWSLTWEDLDDYLAYLKSGDCEPPAWYHAGAQAGLIRRFNDTGRPIDAQAAKVLTLPSLAQMLRFLEKPDADYWRGISDFGAMMAFGTYKGAPDRFHPLVSLQSPAAAAPEEKNGLDLTLADLDSASSEDSRRGGWTLFLRLSSILRAGLPPAGSAAPAGGMIKLFVSAAGGETDACFHADGGDAATAPASDAARPAAAAGGVSPWDALIAEFAGDDEAIGALKVLKDAGARSDFDATGAEIAGVGPLAAWPQLHIAVCSDAQGAALLEKAGWSALIAGEFDTSTLPEQLLERP